MPKGYRTIFSEKSAQSEMKRYRRKGLDGLPRRIAELVKQRGVERILAAAEKRGLKTTLNHRGLLWQVAALDRRA